METVCLARIVRGVGFFDAAGIAARRLHWEEHINKMPEVSGRHTVLFIKTVTFPCLVRDSEEGLKFEYVTMRLGVTIRLMISGQYYGELYIALPGERVPASDIALGVQILSREGSQDVDLEAKSLADIPLPIGPEFATFLVEILRILIPPQGCG